VAAHTPDIPSLPTRRSSDLLKMCEVNKMDEYVDFALQHKGKCLMELARLNDAEACFVKALALRNAKGDAALMDSTEQAIDLVRRSEEHTSELQSRFELVCRL